jgi:hypothetical protein
MTRDRIIGRWQTAAAFAGLLLGMAGFFFHQQIVVARAFASCSNAISAFALASGAASFCVVMIGWMLSWKAKHLEWKQALAGPQGFIAALSVFMAAMSILGIVFSTSVVLFLQCER